LGLAAAGFGFGAAAVLAGREAGLARAGIVASGISNGREFSRNGNGSWVCWFSFEARALNG